MKQREAILASACMEMGTMQRSRTEFRRHLGCLRKEEDRGKGGSEGEKWARDQSNVDRLVGSCVLLFPEVQS